MTKTINWILCVLFALFAIVQYNDPDPWLWILLYGFIAVISGFAAFGHYNRWVVIGGMLICIIGMGMLLPDFISWVQDGADSITGSMKAEEPHIELTREFFGLGVALAALTWHYKKSAKTIL